jgi:putative peptidoglycan lipid II flippase
MFRVPALSPAFRAVVTLIVIFALKDSFGIHAVVLGYIAGELFRLVILHKYVKALKLFNIRISFGWESRFSDFVKTSMYQLVGISLLAFNSLISKTVASWLNPGSVTLLAYANLLYMIPVTFLGGGIIVTLLSYWSGSYQTTGADGLKKNVLKAVKIVGALGLFFTVFIFTIKDYLVNLVYGYGKFQTSNIGDVSTLLGFYLLGLTPYLLSQIYISAYFVKKDTRTLLFVYLFITAGTIVLNLVLVDIMGISGIALANSVITFLAFILLNLLFHTRTKEFSCQ